LAAKGSVQDVYLKAAADAKSAVRISLLNGKDLRGVVKQFDAFTLIVSVKDMDILVYKSAIAAIGPANTP